jgi:hypothetical protein
MILIDQSQRKDGGRRRVRHGSLMMVAFPYPRVSSVPPIMLRGTGAAHDRVVRVTTRTHSAETTTRYHCGLEFVFFED